MFMVRGCRSVVSWKNCTGAYPHTGVGIASCLACGWTLGYGD
jgi:hypothetical protein